MADDDDERFEHHEDILRRLTAMLVEQRAWFCRKVAFLTPNQEITC
jgi:hypothetical protein